MEIFCDNINIDNVADIIVLFILLYYQTIYLCYLIDNLIISKGKPIAQKKKYTPSKHMNVNWKYIYHSMEN